MISDEEYQEAIDEFLIDIYPFLSKVGKNLNIIISYIEQLQKYKEVQRTYYDAVGEHNKALAMIDWILSEEGQDLHFELVSCWASILLELSKDGVSVNTDLFKSPEERAEVFHKFVDEQMIEAAKEAVENDYN